MLEVEDLLNKRYDIDVRLREIRILFSVTTCNKGCRICIQGKFQAELNVAPGGYSDDVGGWREEELLRAAHGDGEERDDGEHVLKRVEQLRQDLHMTSV